MKVLDGTIDLLSSLLEIFATVRSALATYAIAMAVTNGDQTFSLFTVAVVEGALVLSMLSIGFDPVSPITAITALVFSAVMQYLEVTTLSGQLTPDERNILVLALSFAPTVLLALGILRRLKKGGNRGLLDSIGKLFQPSGKGMKEYGFTVPSGQKSWVETRRVKRWRDASGRKRSKHLPTGHKRKKSTTTA